MRISKYLDEKLIKLQMETSFEELDSSEEGSILTAKKLLYRKEKILWECVNLLDGSGKVANKNKLLIDIFNREKKATTALGNGIALPHVRTMQAKKLIIGILVSETGYDFEALDNEPVYIFIPMAAPPYDDSLYLKVFKAVAELFSYDTLYDKIMSAEAPYDIIRAVKELE